MSVSYLINLSLQLLMLFAKLTLIMVVILIVGILFLVTSSLYMRVLSLRKHPYNLLQLSMTEAEYVAVTKSVKEAIWLCGRLIELAVAQGTIVTFFNNHSAIHLTMQFILPRMTLTTLGPNILVSSTILFEIYCCKRNYFEENSYIR